MFRMARVFTSAFPVFLVVAAPSPAHVQEKAPPTLAELEHPSQVAIDKAEELLALVRKIGAEKRTQCLRAFGHASFCECIGGEMPMRASFTDYVQGTMATKEELGYQKLAPVDQKFIDVIRAARDKCVIRTMTPERK